MFSSYGQDKMEITLILKNLLLLIGNFLLISAVNSTEKRILEIIPLTETAPFFKKIKEEKIDYLSKLDNNCFENVVSHLPIQDLGHLRKVFGKDSPKKTIISSQLHKLLENKIYEFDFQVERQEKHCRNFLKSLLKNSKAPPIINLRINNFSYSKKRLSTLYLSKVRTLTISEENLNKISSSASLNIQGLPTLWKAEKFNKIFPALKNPLKELTLSNIHFKKEAKEKIRHLSFTTLEKLCINKCNLSDSELIWIKDNISLTSLQLHYTSVKGTLLNHLLPLIPTLTELDLSNNPLEDEDSLDSLILLKKLKTIKMYIEHPDLQLKAFQIFKQLPSLTTLQIAPFFPTHLEDLSDIPSLENLIISLEKDCEGYKIDKQLKKLSAVFFRHLKTLDLTLISDKPITNVGASLQESLIRLVTRKNTPSLESLTIEEDTEYEDNSDPKNPFSSSKGLKIILKTYKIPNLRLNFYRS
jgi:hypothetical protein